MINIAIYISTLPPRDKGDDPPTKNLIKTKKSRHRKFWESPRYYR